TAWLYPRTSAASEARHALFHERRHTFGVIGGVAELLLVIALDIELLRERMAPAFEHGLPRPREPARRGGGELPGERVDLGCELGVLHTAPDEAPLRRLLGGQLLTEECEAHGTGVAHEPRQHPG